MTAFRPVLEERDINDALLAPRVRTRRFTAVIPAAGRGSRLGYDKPKILYSVGGKTILERMFELLDPFCARFVFVLSPSGAPEVEPELRRLCDGRYHIALQPEPRGMADAVNRAASLSQTVHTLVAWGDQAGLRPRSVELCARLHDGPLAPAATLPTLMASPPYIHFERDAGGTMTRVLQKREGDSMPETGESDCGLFLFETGALLEHLPVLMTSPACIGGATGEFNFLPILPMMSLGGRRVLSARIATAEESVGINTRQEAEFVATRLRSRAGGAQ